MMKSTDLYVKMFSYSPSFFMPHMIMDQICHDPLELSPTHHNRSVTQLLLDKITILSYAASPPLPRPTHLNQP